MTIINSVTVYWISWPLKGKLAMVENINLQKDNCVY
jgi:hypothetical protein